MSKPDNTQELDEILEDFYDGDIRQSDMGKAKQSITDWHNKQVEEVLDRLEQSAVKYGGNNVMNVGVPNIAVPLSVIKAERNKLKEMIYG